MKPPWSLELPEGPGETIPSRGRTWKWSNSFQAQRSSSPVRLDLQFIVSGNYRSNSKAKQSRNQRTTWFSRRTRSLLAFRCHDHFVMAACSYGFPTWGVGQLADRRTVNPEVGGSSPPAPASQRFFENRFRWRLERRGHTRSHSEHER